MQKLYNLVKVSALLLLLLIQNSLQAQNCCLDCQADVKVVTDKQVLLDKIEIKEGTATKLNTNLYVSYRSGNAQKFWANLAIATAGVAVSTQLRSNPSVERNNVNGISPLIPLGVSVATIPSIWKNRPRGVPQAGLWLQHRDTRGKLTDTWEQPISSEAKNSGELLSVNIDKPLSAGTVEVYLQNGSKNPVYYWGLQMVKNVINLIEKKADLATAKLNKSARIAGCPDGYLPNGQGMCCRPGTNDCVSEDDGGGSPSGGCPSGYLPNGQGMCCLPGTNNCVVEGSGSPNTNSTSGVGSGGCSVDVYYKDYDRAAAITGATNGLTSSQDLLDLGYTLLYSIPFDCGTGSTYNSEVQGIPNGTNAYDAYQEFLRRAYEYNNQNQGGSGGGGGNGGTGSGGNPDGPARIDPPGEDNCPSGYLPNGQGMCCNPFTGQCVVNGSGGGGNTDIIVKFKDNSVTNDCIKQFINQLKNNTKVSSRIVSMFRNLYTAGDSKNIEFQEDCNLPTDGKTIGRGEDGNNTGNMLIKINSCKMAGTNQYIASIILHELTHALMIEYSNSPLFSGNGPAQHQQMFDNWVVDLKGALLDFFPLMSGSDALALALGGMDTAFLTGNQTLENAILQFNIQMNSKYGISAQQRDSIINDYKNIPGSNMKGNDCGL